MGAVDETISCNYTWAHPAPRPVSVSTRKLKLYASLDIIRGIQIKYTFCPGDDEDGDANG